MILQTSCGAFRQRERVTLQTSCGAERVNVDSGRLSVFLMMAINSLLYLLKIFIFCSKVIDFLAFFLPGASLALRSHFGAMMHKLSLHTMHTITA